MASIKALDHDSFLIEERIIVCSRDDQKPFVLLLSISLHFCYHSDLYKKTFAQNGRLPCQKKNVVTCSRRTHATHEPHIVLNDLRRVKLVREPGETVRTARARRKVEDQNSSLCTKAIQASALAGHPAHCNRHAAHWDHLSWEALIY